jgi:alpha-L-rhamnosidase
MRPTAPTALLVEHRTDADVVLGVGTARPRLSWTIPDADAGFRQTAYEIEVDRNGCREVFLVQSAEQLLVPWPGPDLASRDRVSARVRVAQDSDWTPWSEPRAFEVGLLEPADWSARFISPTDIGGFDMPAPILSKTFTVPGEVASACLYATAHGVYLARINGHLVAEDVLAPGWTSYSHRLRYQAYDVTRLVRTGVNSVEIVLGNGWFRGRLGYVDGRGLYGDRLSLLAQLEVTTIDGTAHRLASDGSWTARESGIIADDLYDGQVTDLRRAATSEHAPSSGVEILPVDLRTLVAPDGPPIRSTGVLPAQRVWTSPSGRTLADFGQNAVGWVRLRVRDLPAGSTVVIRHAEVLEDAELGTRPLRSAKATDTYIVTGAGQEVLEPAFTLHGFRYAEISGVPDLRAEDLELVVVGSDLRRTGWFSSSHQLLDRFHENVVWSTRGNFVDIPTDCPQRDERLGWTGDAQVFAPTSSFLFDTAGFLSSWLADLAAEQLPDGSVPHVVPDVNANAFSYTPAAAWGDAAAILPWTVYWRTGDRGLLQRQLPSMRAWVDKVTELAGPDRLWKGGFQFGDWLDPTAPPADPFLAKADPDVVATAHLARSAQIVADAARELALDDDAEKYATLAAEVRAAFARAFVTETGRVLSDAPTVYAQAIVWDLLPSEDQRREAGRRLADLVRLSGFRISTGFVGTPLICDALVATGHVEVAYRLLLQTQCPSWLYPVTMGATTIWERWDSMRPDGSINPGEMTSFNHYALGAVADWLHRTLAGLAPAAPGYRTIEIRPVPGAGLTRAVARHLTPYGAAEVAWERTDGLFRVRTTVPVGTTARVHLPGNSEAVVVGHGEHEWSVPDPIAPVPPLDWRDATVRDLMDHEEAWHAVVAAAVSAGVSAGDEHAARLMRPYLDAAAASVAHVFIPDERFPGGAAIRATIDKLIADGAAD